jgi:hypothetical protein
MQGFFMRWWAQQDEDTRALVTQLVEDGQVRSCMQAARLSNAARSRLHRQQDLVLIALNPMHATLTPLHHAARVCQRGLRAA